jgi:hypothetical protein
LLFLKEGNDPSFDDEVTSVIGTSVIVVTDPLGIKGESVPPKLSILQQSANTEMFRMVQSFSSIGIEPSQKVLSVDILQRSDKDWLPAWIISSRYGSDNLIENASVVNVLQCPRENPNPKPTLTSSAMTTLWTAPRVTILSQMPRDR